MVKMKDCTRLFDAFVSSFFWALNYFVGGEEYRVGESATVTSV